MSGLTEAYAVCSEIARREAKNFYYSFRVLPEHKRNAMCAVYAFMRRADDIADDESQTVEQRRETMAAWLAEWRLARAGAPTDNPVFIAVADVQQRFKIPDQLLEELVQGTSMDLEPVSAEPRDGHAVQLADGTMGYRSFEDLYRYCYLVASVVGLVCIRIFGYSDPAAELLAEKTGIAFQLTNILRDIKEDAERGRIYLPQQLLEEFGITSAEIRALAGGAPLRTNDRAMIDALSVQAWEYYAAADKLLPLIDRDSRPALWVLVRIYSELLHKIEHAHGDVFSKRARVSTPGKLWILAQGAAKSVLRR
ncbi:phytoene/squalene synthase family protein [Granulicella sp. WH15]|uniref:phytoene/squalene synthase family protein n=1 Tax=Granulicella sp. WH15 TaxID=2602070 RepID=UPI00136745F7|nr:phytoene/squalene synthase family protein [Granulicella sp. WH15]QHN04037.1 phytoene/squalene synthase family protein [Granulicella sp. WH15]